MSLNFIFGNLSSPALKKVHCDYVAQRVFQRKHDFGPSGSMAIRRNDKTLGVVIFHNWIPEHGIIELSAAAESPAWLCRRSINMIMRICFTDHDCQQIVSRMAIDNKRAIQIYDFIGFDTIILPNMRGKDKHEHLKLLTKDQWATNRLNEANRHVKKPA